MLRLLMAEIPITAEEDEVGVTTQGIVTRPGSVSVTEVVRQSLKLKPGCIAPLRI